MISQIEMKYYKDVTRIADALERIARSLEKDQKYEEGFVMPELGAAVIGCRIRERIRELGMTEQELAIACDVDVKSIRNYIIGYTVPKGPMCSKIAVALGRSVDWLFGGKENE